MSCTRAVGSSPAWLTRSGDALYFSAAGREVGRELWKYAPAPAPAIVVARHVFYNHSAFDGSDADANAADDGAIAPDKNALLACLLYTSPSPRDRQKSRMPSSA